MNFQRIKENYDSGLWSKQMVALAVKKGVITAYEYLVITGEPYKEVV